VIDFVNLKIKPIQSFRYAHKDRVCVCVYKDECSYVYEYLYLYCVSKKTILQLLGYQGQYENISEKVQLYTRI
jgi:hypothetical protein